jgi:hypothetical protein
MIRIRALTKVPAFSTCSKCGERKASNQFARREFNRHGLAYHCNDCERDYQRRCRISNQKQRRKEADVSPLLYLVTTNLGSLDILKSCGLGHPTVCLCFMKKMVCW